MKLTLAFPGRDSFASGVALGLALLAMASPAHATLVDITTPVGVYTEPGPANTGDPFATGTWLRTNVRNNGAVGITGNYARNGNGSMWFNTPDGSAKADAEYFFDGSHGVSPFLLNDILTGAITEVSYEWYRDSASTNPDVQQPSFRLYVDIDGNSMTLNDIGYLIYENIYNVGGPAPTDTWTKATIGANTNLWWVGLGAVAPGPLFDFDITVADWVNGGMGGGEAVGTSAASTVIGVSVGAGSGWNGNFLGAVDTITFGDAMFNFETPNQVPLPGTLLLLGLGLGLIGRQRGIFR